MIKSNFHRQIHRKFPASNSLLGADLQYKWLPSVKSPDGEGPLLLFFHFDFSDVTLAWSDVQGFTINVHISGI